MRSYRITLDRLVSTYLSMCSYGARVAPVPGRLVYHWPRRRAARLRGAGIYVCGKCGLGAGACGMQGRAQNPDGRCRVWGLPTLRPRSGREPWPPAMALPAMRVKCAVLEFQRAKRSVST